MNFAKIILLAALGWAAGLVRADDGARAARVIVVANAADPESLRVARHYAAARGVPTENVIALPMPPTEEISWGEFIETVWNPLRAELVRRKWIDGLARPRPDAWGRRSYLISGHRIAALAVCRGVPLKIRHDAARYAATPPGRVIREFQTNAGAVDAELTLLAQDGHNINANVPNPVFKKDRLNDFDRAKVVPVSRLDGPTVEDALALVDRALEAERTGLVGRAYVDIGGPHAEGDRWLDDVVGQLAALGFDPAVDRAGTTMPATARADAPALYFGWYAGDLGGPFALPGFRFPPGAVALHIHSFSAATLRARDHHWTGPLVARGVTATVGNVYEPYLQLTHRPDLFLRALARGETLADAGLYALPVLSWQSIVVGDPLYRPFAVTSAAAWQNRARLPEARRGYAARREMKILEAMGRFAEAGELARTAQREAPNLALALVIARQFEAEGKPVAAGAALGFAARRPRFEPDEWAQAREVAQALGHYGRKEQAAAVYRTLLGEADLPAELRAAWETEVAAVKPQS